MARKATRPAECSLALSPGSASVVVEHVSLMRIRRALEHRQSSVHRPAEIPSTRLVDAAGRSMLYASEPISLRMKKTITMMMMVTMMLKMTQ